MSGHESFNESATEGMQTFIDISVKCYLGEIEPNDVGAIKAHIAEEHPEYTDTFLDEAAQAISDFVLSQQEAGL